MYMINAELQKRAEKLEKMRSKLIARLAKAPEGKLRVNKKSGHLQYYHRTSKADRTGRYLNAEEGRLIVQLAQKDNDERELKAIEKELEAIRSYFAKYPAVSLEEVYGKLTPARRALVTPGVETDEMFLERWKKRYHTDESFSKGRPEYVTERGELVRSKSEVIIANTLNRMLGTYCYEPAVTLPGRGTVHPDFAVPNLKRRTTIFIEHQGKMGDPEYANTAVLKQNSYILSGIYPGDQLFFTMETEEVPLNTQVLELVIRKAFH